MWNQAKHLGISPLQIQLLIFIANHSEEYANVTYLATEFLITKPTISGAIKVLVKKKLLEKKPSEIDKRAFSLVLTSEGQKAVEAASAYTDPLQKAIKKQSPADQARFFVTLNAILEGLESSEQITIQRGCRSCGFFERDEVRGSDFCQHFDQYLLPRDLRLDCPEFESA